MLNGFLYFPSYIDEMSLCNQNENEKIPNLEEVTLHVLLASAVQYAVLVHTGRQPKFQRPRNFRHKYLMYTIADCEDRHLIFRSEVIILMHISNLHATLKSY